VDFHVIFELDQNLIQESLLAWKEN